MADVKWIKITTDMFDNRKIKHLRKLPEGNNIVLIWVMLLTMAGRCNANGMIFLTENIPYTIKMLADELDFEENTVRLALEALTRFDMILMDGDFFSIPGWRDHQNIDGMERIREQNRIRKQRQREKQALIEAKTEEKTLSRNRSRECHVTVTRSHDADIDIELDIDKDINNNTLCPEPLQTPDQKAVIYLILNDKTEYPIYSRDIEEWKSLYQSVDIMQELRNMRGWLNSNPERRKTKRGIKRFINAWLAKEQDKPKVQKTDSKTKNSFMNFEQRNTDYNALVANYSGFGGR